MNNAINFDEIKIFPWEDAPEVKLYPHIKSNIEIGYGRSPELTTVRVTEIKKLPTPSEPYTWEEKGFLTVSKKTGRLILCNVTGSPGALFKSKLVIGIVEDERYWAKREIVKMGKIYDKD